MDRRTLDPLIARVAPLALRKKHLSRPGFGEAFHDQAIQAVRESGRIFR